MKKALLFLTLFYFAQSHSLIIYEKGYFISNDGIRTECLIENIDWQNNPTVFKYKKQPNEEPQKNPIAEVREFGIDGVSQYKRYDVKMERSGTHPDVRFLVKSGFPEFKNETLFLQTVVSGKASLYVYQQQNVINYFYETDLVPVEQLIRIVYTMTGKNRPGRTINSGNSFRKIWFARIGPKPVSKNLAFNKNALSRIFIRYNQCKGDNGNLVNFTSKEKRDTVGNWTSPETELILLTDPTTKSD